MELPRGDKLVLRGLKFHGFHGVKHEEKTIGQKFVIDVDAWMDLLPASFSDNLLDIVSYTAIYRDILGFQSFVRTKKKLLSRFLKEEIALSSWPLAVGNLYGEHLTLLSAVLIKMFN